MRVPCWPDLRFTALLRRQMFHHGYASATYINGVLPEPSLIVAEEAFAAATYAAVALATIRYHGCWAAFRYRLARRYCRLIIAAAYTTLYAMHYSLSCRPNARGYKTIAAIDDAA